MRHPRIALGALLTSSVFLAQGCDRPTSPSPPANGSNGTARNGESGTTSAFDQSEKPEDIRISAEIRRLLVDDPSLSVQAKNCTVVTANGLVTLDGFVDTEAERSTVESKAKTVAGVSSVLNRLSVKTS